MNLSRGRAYERRRRARSALLCRLKALPFPPLLLLLPLPGLAQEEQRSAEVPREPAWFDGTLTVGAGAEYSSGDYGADVDTNVWFAPFSLNYLFEEFAPTPFPNDQLELRVTIPYLWVNGPGVLIDGGVVVPPNGEARTADGIGDIWVRATYIYYPPARTRLPVLEFRGKIKIPTADERKGLGTGVADGSLELQLSKRFGPVSPFASFGYRFLGGRPAFARNGVFLASVGAGYRPSSGPFRRVSAGILYDFRQASTLAGDDIHELVPYAWIDVTERFRVGPYAVAGLSDGSPNWAVGLQLRLRVPFFDRPGR